MKNKKLKWLIPSCAVAVLAVVALVLVFVLSGDGGKTAAQQAEFKVYWNVDGQPYRAQEMIRSANSEGQVHITFSVDGQQVRMPVANLTLANEIDALEVMGLAIDKNGVVTDCYRVEDMDGKIIANRYFVTAVDGNKITCNSAPSLKGYDVTFEITEDTGVWDVGMEGITCGIPGTVKVDDQVIVVLDREGNTETVYVIPYQAPPDIYWNVERKYNSTTKTTTREMDPTGGYSILLAVGGEHVTVKTRDYEIVKAIDAMAAKCFALEFDENGMVNKVTHAGSACGGGSCASWYSVDEFADNYIRTTKLSTGATYSGLVSRNVLVYDVSGHGAFVGEPTTIRVGDTVHCLRDSMGRIVVAFVVDRIVESEMYWNVERKWDSETSLTTRTPASDGWYYIKVAVGGKQITVKTQDKEHVQTIDARAAKCFGLKLDGDVIQKVYQPASVTGGGTFASWYDVTALDGKKLTCYKISTEDTKQGTMTADCQVYNVSATADLVGEETKLQLGDRVHALKDREGNVCVIYVVTRFYNYPTYYNLSRKWDATKKVTTRQPDAQGFYVFEMAFEGKTVTVKTKSKDVANDIDSQAAKCVALEVSNGIVYKAVHPSSTTAYKGGPTSSYTNVTSMNKYGFSTKKVENGKVTKTYNEQFASDCKIYNVSSNVLKNVGEKTTLQVGDQVHCLKNSEGKVALIYVLTRYQDLGVYYNLDRKWDSARQTTTRVPDAQGYYVFQMAHKGQEVTVKTKSLEVANDIDSQVAKVLGIQFDRNGLAVKAIHAKATVECKGGIGVSYADIVAIKGNQVTTVKDGKTTTFTLSSKPNIFDVSSRYKVNRGERTTLRVGDLIHCLKNGDGKTHYVYVLSRELEMIKTQHSCQHVTEKVQWYEWNGKDSFGKSGHYVLTQDAQLTGVVTVKKGLDVTVCLNGHTVSSDTRIFKIYGKLNICDHKDADGNYHGKLTSSYSDTLDAEGKVIEKAYAGIAYLYNSEDSSELNVYGGILEHTGSVYNGGLVYVANKSDNPNNTATFNLYDGVLTGGKATAGGAVYVSNLGGFGMYGGTITDCSATEGGAVFMNTAKGAIHMDGGTIRNCTSNQTGAAMQIDNGTVIMTGGIITGNMATGSGGGISLDGGELRMYGGILDGNTGNEGGNLRIARYATVVLTDDAKVQNGSASNGGNITMFGKLTVAGNAQIVGGKATGLGSAISIFSNYDDAEVKLNMLGGNIEGQIRLDSRKAVSVDVYLLGGMVESIKLYNNVNGIVVPQVHVGGTATVKEIILPEGRNVAVYADSLEDTASIGIAMADISQPFTTITDPNDASCFHAVDSKLYKVENVDNALYLVSALEPHIHCVCGGHLTDANVGSHTECDGTVEWTPWDGTTAMANGGHYYLYDSDEDGKITVDAAIEITAGSNVSLCLNGVTLEGTGNRILQVNGGDTTTVMNICDCHEEAQWGSMVSAGTGVAPLIHSYTNNRGTVEINIFGGNYQSLEATPTYGDLAGLIRLGNTGTLAEGEKYPSTLNMYGGHISGGSGKIGGNLYISHGCTFNMYGGSITGGYASITGGNVYIADSAKMYVTGDVTITSATSGGNLFLAEKAQLTVGDLADASEIYIQMAKPGQFTQITDTNDAKCFYSDDGNYLVKHEGGKMSLVRDPATIVTNHKHCVCVGNTAEDHTCAESTSWQELTQDNVTEFFTLVGSYYNLKDGSANLYLGTDVDLSYPIEVLDGHSLNLCLNGKTMTHSAAKNSTIRLHGDLSITDCSAEMTGELTSNRKGESPTVYILNRRTVSSGVYTYHTPTLNLYAGNLTAQDQDATQKAGVMQVGNMLDPANKDNYATFNMFGGKIHRGVASKGGNLFVESAVGVFNMYGGEISGGKATNGGNVYVNNGQMNMYGGTITGGEAQTGAGVHVHSAAAASVTLSGLLNITGNTGGNLYLSSGKTFQIGSAGLDDNSVIGITMAVAGQFTTITDSKDATCFRSDNNDYAVANNNGVLSLQDKNAVVTHVHCLCNGNAKDLGDHTCADDTQWQAWTNKNALPTTSGNYYLDVDVTLSAMFEMKGKLDLRICLNSHTITGPGGGKRAFLLRDADLHITDCQETGKITNEATSSLNGGLIYQYSGSSCNDYNNSANLYGGTLTTTGTAKSGGVLYLGNNTNKAYYATFNLYGGTITGGKTTGSGGNITVTNGSMLNVYGGTISGGEAGGTGGNISQNGGAGIICLLGGAITGGKSATSGNDVYVDEAVTLGGQVKIGELFLKDAHTVEISSELPLTGEASVGIKKSTAELFATNVTDALVQSFFKNLTDWQIVYDEAAKTLSFAR